MTKCSATSTPDRATAARARDAGVALPLCPPGPPRQHNSLPMMHKRRPPHSAQSRCRFPIGLLQYAPRANGYYGGSNGPRGMLQPVFFVIDGTRDRRALEGCSRTEVVIDLKQIRCPGVHSRGGAHADQCRETDWPAVLGQTTRTRRRDISIPNFSARNGASSVLVNLTCCMPAIPQQPTESSSQSPLRSDPPCVGR